MKRMTLALLIVLLLSPSLRAQAPFYQGKTIRIVVGYLAGDVHDLWARAYSRHMGRHIPGNPDFIVQNMPGAGTMIAANHIYNLTKPDGLTLGSIAPALYYAQLTGRKEVQFDWSKFTWIGSPDRNGHLLFMRSDTPYKTLEDIRNAKEPPRCSATAIGTSGHDVPKLFEDTLGMKFRIITGYPGGGEQDLALERGEVQCRAITIASFFAREPFHTWHRTGFVRVLIQTARQRHPKIPDVPTIYELMDRHKTSEARRRFATVYLGAGGFGAWPIVSSPGVPLDRVKILREAYTKTLKDPELLEEAKKRGWETKPVSGDELEALAKEVITQPPEVVEWLKKLLGK
ncbi:MAG: Bug family tripartite tricarboxylate transporter substrate binding protein [Candidatus Binatia bacterium]